MAPVESGVCLFMKKGISVIGFSIQIPMVEILNHLTQWLQGGLYLKKPICNLVKLFLTQFVSMVADDVGFLTK